MSELHIAQRDKTPEGRMRQGQIIRSIVTEGKDMRSKDGTPPLERLFSKVAFGSCECWFWTGFICRLGYGIFHCLGETRAHRVAYKLFKGDIPKGMKVMHSCDTRNCVNPDHLSIGTQADNVRDMIAKGRGGNGDVRGEKNPMARATPEMVRQIRDGVAKGDTQAKYARLFGLSRMAVSRIARGESWNV